MGKGLRRGIKQSTQTRADKKLGRVFVDLRGPEVVESHVYSHCARRISRFTWVNIVRHKSDAVEMFEQFVADTRADGVPSQMVTIRSDGGGEFCGETLAIYVDRNASSKNSPRRAVHNSMG